MMYETMQGQSGLPRWSETVFSVIKKIEFGTMSFTLPDGRSFVAKGAKPGPTGHFNIHDPKLFGRIVREGDMGFAEAYMDGWWDTEDLESLLDVALLNNDDVASGFPGRWIIRAYDRLLHWLRSNTKSGSRKNISYHYDLGNDFYSLWLDETMTYSSALYSGQGETLAQAQQNKYASICDRMGLDRDNHVLEIGCGWGGFAEYAIRERGARVTGLTLSKEQHDFAKKRLFEAGLAERADIVMRDYRDETGKYDGIASIEMFEAVGEKYWPTYFQAVYDRLKPGKQATIQMITIAEGLFDNYRRSTDFIQKYIFPGGMLASPSAAQESAEAQGLKFVGSMEFGQCYARTLRSWYQTFNEKWSDVSALGFDDRFRKMWNFYLAGCASTFAAGTTDVTQITLRRPA
ncbi:MAG: cyclopropane-fatty-acyl-phospholipid synthase family protein [Pseudomonadota bacterium]